MRRLFRTICPALLFLPLITQAQTGTDRLRQGEILYESLLGHPLEALLAFNSDLPSGHQSSSAGAISITDAELSLGLSDTVEKRSTGRSDDEAARRARNRDAYKLARFYYNQRKPSQALAALDRIQGKADSVSGSDVDYLRALVYLNIGRFSEAAEILYELPLIQQPRGYTQYNLAMAQLLDGNEERGRETLAGVGRLNTGDSGLLALKDLANIKLGYRYLQEGSLEQAKASFDRVRLDGPFTNQALLGSGWTSFSTGKIDRAIVAWSMLHEQEAISDTVIEAKMALPYAYSKLGAHGKAANLYAHAVELLETELSRLDAASAAVRKGTLSRLIVDNDEFRGEDWFVSLSRNSAQADLFLPLLLANHEFSEQADSLHQLAQLRRRIEQARISAAVSTEYAGLKRKHYASALPATEKELAAIDLAVKKILPTVPPQTDAAGKAVKPIAAVAQLQQTYDEAVTAHKAAANHNRRLPEFSRELAELKQELKRIHKKLDQAIVGAGKQLEAIALATLDRKRNQLKGYHHNALFALAESYDFATGKRQ